jgi:lipopolysaccharide biosynthesis regulator YciM
MLTKHKQYKTFAEHPLSSTYFKYIDILIKDGFNKDIEYLINIANAPLTDEIQSEISEILTPIYLLIREHDIKEDNEFLELEKEIAKAH